METETIITEIGIGNNEEEIKSVQNKMDGSEETRSEESRTEHEKENNSEENKLENEEKNTKSEKINDANDIKVKIENAEEININERKIENISTDKIVNEQDNESNDKIENTIEQEKNLSDKIENTNKTNTNKDKEVESNFDEKNELNSKEEKINIVNRDLEFDITVQQKNKEGNEKSNHRQNGLVINNENKIPEQSNNFFWPKSPSEPSWLNYTKNYLNNLIEQKTNDLSNIPNETANNSSSMPITTIEKNQNAHVEAYPVSQQPNSKENVNNNNTNTNTNNTTTTIDKNTKEVSPTSEKLNAWTNSLSNYFWSWFEPIPENQNNMTKLDSPSVEAHQPFSPTGDKLIRLPVQTRKPSIQLMERSDDVEPVVTQALTEYIRPHLPALQRESTTWTLRYSIEQHGVSLNTLYNNVKECGPLILAIRDNYNNVNLNSLFH